MKTILSKYFLFLFILCALVVSSCGSRNGRNSTGYDGEAAVTVDAVRSRVYEDIIPAIEYIDSAAAELYGYEPKDSTYDKERDEMLSDLAENYERVIAGTESNGSGSPTISQETFDRARETWAKFKSLCYEKRGEEALDFYLGKDPKTGNSNEGDFLVFLKHSSLRYKFDSEVLLPLIVAFMDREEALAKYTDVLLLEKSLEEASMALSEEEIYVPEVYIDMMIELGYFLSISDRGQDAQNLTEDVINTMTKATGSALLGNYFGTEYWAGVGYELEMPDAAIRAWQQFADFLEENRESLDKEDLDNLMSRIDYNIAMLRRSMEEQQ